MAQISTGWKKAIKTAWKRMTKIRQNADANIQQKLIDAEAFLCRLNLFREKSSADSIILLIQEFYDNACSRFEKQHRKILHDGELFAKIQKMPEAEKNDHLEEIKRKLDRDRKAFEAPWIFNLKLFGLKVDEKPKAITQSEEIVEVVTALTDDYLVYPIAWLKIIDSRKMGIDIKSKQYLTGNDAFDIVTNGTFFTFTGSEMIIHGSLLANKKELVQTKTSKAAKRGGLAVLESGMVVIEQATGNTAKEVQERYSEPIKLEIIPIPEIFEQDLAVEYLGGGALLIQNSQPFSGADLFSIQRFDNMDTEHVNSTDGFDAMQMYATQHVVFGIRNEQPYLVVPCNKINKLGKDAKTIQQDLMQIGFTAAIKFDGGGEFYINAKDLKITKGKNSPTGFAVKTIKFGKKKK